MSAEAVLYKHPSNFGLVTEASEFVARWVYQQLGAEPVLPCQAIGVIRGKQLVTGWVYHQTDQTPHVVELTVAAKARDGISTWMRPDLLKVMFAYPFVQLGAERLQVIVARKNKKARKVVKHLGWTYEGMARKAGPNGEDMAIYSMLRDECRWLT